MLLLPLWLQAAELRLVADSPTPKIGSHFNVYVVSTEGKQVLGVDLRFQFDSQAVALEELQAKRITQFHWHKSQKDIQRGYAVTGLMLPQENQTLDLQNNDTLAVVTFSRLNAEPTSISLKADYPILINSNLQPITCAALPLMLEKVTSVADENNVPVSKNLQVSNYPNPFNPKTKFQIVSDQNSQHANLQIYDITGRLVWQKEFIASTGTNFITWHGVDRGGRPVPAGVYFYRCRLNQEFAQGKCVIIR